jgi:peroxiredoxin Q/BCP
MAQLRQQYGQFQEREAEIIVTGPDRASVFKNFWRNHNLPFIGLPDPENRIADLYQQEVNILKLGRLPALFVIDPRGAIQYLHYGDSMQDIPSIQSILEVLDSINEVQMERVI